MRFPTPPGTHGSPEWTGSGFIVGNLSVPVLSYEVGKSGWTDELTEVHEEEAGEDHYIDRASRWHALDQLQKWLCVPAPLIMDIGCSSGFFLKLLKRQMPHAHVVGSDYVRGPLESLAVSMPDIPLLQFDLLNCPLPATSFDALVLLNVFEHIENDIAAAQEVFRLLKPGGIAVIEVPAGPHLYDIYDQMLMHHRRYDMLALLRILRSAGFEIVERSHLGFLLYPGFYLVKKRNQRLLNADVALQRAAVRKNISQSKNNPVFHTIMKVESGLRNWMYMPTGIRCLVTCKRPDKTN